MGKGVGAERRGKALQSHRVCRLLGSPGPWLNCLLWGTLVRLRGCQEGQRPGHRQFPSPRPEDTSDLGASSLFPRSRLHNSARSLDDERARRDIGVVPLRQEKPVMISEDEELLLVSSRIE